MIRIDDRDYLCPEGFSPQVSWRSGFEPPFSVHGAAQLSPLCRLPLSLHPSLREPVQRLSYNASGIRIRFATDSTLLYLAFAISNTAVRITSTPFSYAGLELYQGDKYIAFLKPREQEGDNRMLGQRFADCLKLPGGMREYTIYLPCYAVVESLHIAVEEGAALAPAKPYTIEKPILFYGSSITHGACASRASLNYPALCCRWLDAELYNLGFSGNAKGELEMARYIAQQPMSAFVYDYDHNAPTIEFLAETHEPFFRLIREARPQLPIVMLSRPAFEYHETSPGRREVIYRTYQNALAGGDKKVWFLDGEKLLGAEDRDVCLQDFVHPNDTGYYRMAKAVMPYLKEMLGL